MVCYSLFAVVAAILTTITFVLLARLHQFNENDIRPRTIQEGMTVELSFGVGTELLEKGSLGIDNDYYGCLYILSLECSATISMMSIPVMIQMIT